MGVGRSTLHLLRRCHCILRMIWLYGCMSCAVLHVQLQPGFQLCLSSMGALMSHSL